MFKRVILIPLYLLLASVPAFALTGGPSMPDYTQFEEVTATNVVDPNSGNFTYTIPLLDVPGPEGGYPVALSYHSGINHEQEATWVGLGWSLNAGAINRIVRGVPDDYLNAVVTTHNLAEANYGVLSVNVGYGPLGLSTAWETNSGENLGASPYFSVAGMLSMIENLGPTSQAGAALGGFYANNPAVAAIAHSMDVTISPQGVNVSLELGFAGEIGKTKIGIQLASVSVYNDWNKFGPSIRASLSPGVGLHGMTVGGSIGSNSTGDGYLAEHDFGTIGIAYMGFHFGIGFKSYKWTLDETNWDLMSGFLWQAGANGGVAPRRSSNGETILNPDGSTSYTPGKEKYERMKVARDATTSDLFTAQDLYMVAANGLMGSFEPFFAAPYTGYTGVFPTLQDGDENANLEGMKPLTPASLSDITFRMDGDMGRNLLHTPGGQLDQLAPFQPSGSSQKQYGSYRIDPVFDIEPTTQVKRGSLKGFRIRDTEGKTYEFMQPVKNYLTSEYTSEDPNVLSSNRSERTLYDPYAGSWLITAIKGADYVEMGDLDGKPSEGDYGYWVKFNYGAPTPAAWATPYAGNVGSPTGDDIPGKKIYHRTNGYKELVYLSSIETETHRADFQTEARLDGYSIQNGAGARVKLPPIRYPVSPLGSWDVVPHVLPDIPYSLEFPGDLISLLERIYLNKDKLTTADLNKPILHITENWNSVATGYVIRGVGFSIADIWERTQNPALNPYPADLGGSVIVNRAFDPNTGNTKFDFNWHYNPDEVPRRIYEGAYRFELQIKSFAFVDLNMIEYLLERLPPEIAFPPPRLLSRVDLINKMAPAIPLKSAQFRYNYELCPNTPNSHALATLNGSTAPYYVGGSQAGGKLTLKEVQVSGRGISIPSYGFAYQTGAANPGYGDKEKYDAWGMYKADGAVNKHLTNQGNDQEGVCWNLNHIQLPMGGFFDLQYQRDSYYFAGTAPHLLDGKESVFPDYSAMNIPIDAAGKPSFAGLAKVIVPTHARIDYGNDAGFLNPLPGKTNDNVSGEFFKLPVTSVNLGQVTNLQVGDYVFIIQVLKVYHQGETPIQRMHNGILNMAIVKSVASPSNLVLEPLIQKTSSGGFFLWKDFSYDSYDFNHEYYLLPVANPGGNRIFYGGDVAVKSLTTSDGLNNSYKNIYDYVAKDVRSATTTKAYDAEYASGGTFGLPLLYQSRLQFFPALGGDQMDVGLRMESNPNINFNGGIRISRPVGYDPVGDFIKKTYYSGDKPGGYYYPNPGITYSRVSIQQVPADGSSARIGSTEYQFNGLAYYFLHAGSTSAGQPVPNRQYPDWNVTDAAYLLTIKADVLSKRGQMAAIVTYDKNAKVVSLMENKYAQAATLYNKGTPKDNLAPGWLEQTYSSQTGVGTSSPGHLRTVQFYSPSNFLVGSATTMDGVISTVNNIGFDAFSGSALAFSKTNSDGRTTVNYSLPAYWVRPEMEQDNALTQIRENRTYGLLNGEAFIPTNLNKVISANFSEWSTEYSGPDGGANAPTHKWHTNYTANWNPVLDANGIPRNVYQKPPDGVCSVNGFSTDWVIPKYYPVFNRFSMPVESRNIFKNSSTATYTGHGTNLVVGIVTDAAFSEAGIFTGDYDLDKGMGPYFDKFNRWERGAPIGDPAHVSEVVVGPHVFGTKSVHVLNAYGPTLNVSYGQRPRQYVLSAWIRPISGTTTVGFDFRNSLGQTIKDRNNVQVPAIASVDITADGQGFRLVQAIMPADRLNVTNTLDEVAMLRGFVGCPNGGEAYIQDIRFCPLESMATSYFYDPVTQDLLTVLDENNHPRYFSYDGLSRLTLVKNEQLETVSEASYQFFGP